MGNLRPAPTDLAPQRVDMLLGALDARIDVDARRVLARLGLPEEDVSRVLAFAEKLGRNPLAVAGGLVALGLDRYEGRPD